MRKFILFTTLFLFSTLLFGQSEAFEQGKISPFTAFFISQLNEIESDSTQQIMQQRFGLRTQAERQYISAFIELNENVNPDFLSEYSVKINTQLPELNMLTAKIPVEKIETVALLSDVKYLEIGTPVESKMSAARPLANIHLMHDGINLDMPYTGKGVVVGIVDIGFDLNHINFFSSDQSRYRIMRFWNQNDDTGTPPSDFTYGSEFKTEADIRAARHDMRDETHGTHVAGIAAGADLYNHNIHGQNFGVAPDAYLVFVSTSRNTVAVLDGVRYIFQYAESVNKPAVVNLSLGSHIGPHDGTSWFDQMADGLQGEGRLLVGAAGNDGGRPIHISKTFQPNDTLKTFLARTNSGSIFDVVEIWGDPNRSYSVQFFSYNTQNGVKTPITEVHASTAAFGRTDYPLNAITHGINGNISVLTHRNNQNRKANTQIHLNISSISSTHIIALKITTNIGTVNAWINSNNFRFSSEGREADGWTSGTTRSTVSEVGGTGRRIISVGAYVSTQTNSGALHDIASFSSRGPTADGRMKPEITAPGSMIISSYSDVISIFNPNVAYTHTIDGQRFLYGQMQGTSMSAPFVTGVLAAWLQAKNDLTPEEVRVVLRETAINDEYTGDVRLSGSNIWGYGKIDAWSGIQMLLREEEILKELGENIDIKIFSNMQYRELRLRLMNKESRNVQMRIFNVSGQLIMQQQVFTEGNETIIPLSKIGGGVFIVSFTGENLHARPQRIIMP